MRRSQGSLEVLLVLCCLVGAVAFLAFSMGVLNLATAVEHQESTNPSRLINTSDSLARQVDRKTAELGKIKELIAALEKALEEKRKQWTAMSRIGPTDDLAQRTMARLKKEIQAADERLQQLEKLRERLAAQKGEEDQFNPWKDFKGAELLRNPLFVECKKYSIIIYPQKTLVSTSELADNNPFAGLSQNYDAVIFLIRPDGYETFQQANSWSEKMNWKIGYEPVNAEWKLSFVK